MKISGGYITFFLFLLIFAACTINKEVTPTVQREAIQFAPNGNASLSIPSLNGNKIAVRIKKPEGDGPFPVLIGLARGDGMFAFKSALPTRLREKGIMTVDFAPQGRGGSEGDDNHYGFMHQDDLKALADFANELSFVQKDNIGILSGPV